MDDACEVPVGVESATWPEANFGCWPYTRMAANAFNGISIILWVIPQMWRHYHNCIMWNGFGGPFFFGLWVGLFVHFIPCIWWTCDWGYYDGYGIRGGIWFTVWGAASGVFYWYYSQHKDAEDMNLLIRRKVL